MADNMQFYCVVLFVLLNSSIIIYKSCWKIQDVYFYEPHTVYTYLSLIWPLWDVIQDNTAGYNTALHGTLKLNVIQPPPPYHILLWRKNIYVKPCVKTCKVYVNVPTDQRMLTKYTLMWYESLQTNLIWYNAPLQTLGRVVFLPYRAIVST